MLVDYEIAATLYDEVIGRNYISDKNYNEYLLGFILPDRLNVLAIHAEVEGISKNQLFLKFLERAKKMNVEFIPLGCMPDDVKNIPLGTLDIRAVPGRDGTMCVQGIIPPFYCGSLKG